MSGANIIVRDTITPNIKALESRAASPMVGNIINRELDIVFSTNFRVFGRSKSGAGGQWPPRKKSKFSHRLLHKSGALAASVQAQKSARYAGGQHIIRRGSNKKYAAIHNFGGIINHPGTDNGYGKGIQIPAHPIPIPKREFLNIPDGDAARISQHVTNYVMMGAL